MRLAPKTLFGRMTLILILGLILAQVISATLLLKDRRDIIQDRFGLQLIQRIASVVTLMEEMSPQKREQMLTALSSATFRVTLSDTPYNESDAARSSNHLAFLLSQALPGHKEVRVSVGDISDRFRHRRDRRPDESGTMPMERRRDHQPGFRPWRSAAKPVIATAQVKLRDGQWIIFSRPLPDEAVHWPMKVLGFLLALLVSIIIIALIAVRLVTKPLTTLSAAAESLGKNIDNPPLAEKGPQEVRQAAQAFNTMQKRLQRYIDDRNQVLAAVSHDLKTPITRLRLRTELLEDSQLASKIDADLNEMEQMVTASLDYLRGTDSKEKSVTVDIRALLESIQDDIQEMGWEVSLATGKIPPIKGRPLGLKRCLSNLIENAVRYGSKARISFQDTPQQLTIVIADEGPGIPDGDLEGLFKPFNRGEKSRSKETGGTGLGLGIARNIARSHGGDVVLRAGEPRGLEAVVTLPR